jgi:hypothetical protein
MDTKEEKRRKKMLKKMRKIVLTAWQHPGSEPFQSSQHSLKGVGQSVEDEVYANVESHRQGWEDFARDLGMVYNHHIARYVVVMEERSVDTRRRLSGVLSHSLSHTQLVLVHM